MSTRRSYEEKELLLRISKGDEIAFRWLADNYNARIATFISAGIGIKRRELVEEVVCDVLLQVWLTRDILPSLQDLGNYLFILARNKGLDTLKKELREQGRRQLWNHEEGTAEDLERQRLEEQALGLIDEAVSRLPPQQRKVWILSRKKAMTYVQIGTELNISRETVKSYLQAANHSIRQFVTARMEELPSVIWIILLSRHYLYPVQ